jgi:hypothetical protein
LGAKLGDGAAEIDGVGSTPYRPQQAWE